MGTPRTWSGGSSERLLCELVCHTSRLLIAYSGWWASGCLVGEVDADQYMMEGFWNEVVWTQTTCTNSVYHWYHMMKRISLTILSRYRQNRDVCLLVLPMNEVHHQDLSSLVQLRKPWWNREQRVFDPDRVVFFCSCNIGLLRWGKWRRLWVRNCDNRICF